MTEVRGTVANGNFFPVGFRGRDRALLSPVPCGVLIKSECSRGVGGLEIKSFREITFEKGMRDLVT